MILLRHTSPPKYADYRRYKPLLRGDFCYRCGYCRTHEREFGSVWNMTIDHFRPRSRFPRLAADYANLHYCCNECNTYKGDLWPTDAQLANGYCFVEACLDDLDDHYEFVELEIKPRTRPGEFTVAALRLNRPTLLARRRDVAAKRSAIIADLERLGRLRTAASENPDDLQDLDALHANRIDDLRLLDSPIKLES